MMFEGIAGEANPRAVFWMLIERIVSWLRLPAWV